MKTLLALVSRYALPILMLCAGALIGLGMAYPLFGWTLPDLTANLLAGAVGSIGTVAGAFLVLKKQLEDARKVAKEALHAELQKEEARRKSTCLAISNALYADLKSAQVLISRSIEIACDNTKKLNDHDRSMWIQRFAHFQVPSFNRFYKLVWDFGDNVAAVLLHVYGELSRIAAICNGQQVTNNNAVDNAEFIAGFLPVLAVIESNVRQALDKLNPFIDGESLPKVD